MRTSIIGVLVSLVALAMACSSSSGSGSGSGSSSGGGGATFSCENPSASQSTCYACVNSKCTSELSSLSSSCPTALACLAKCDCSDATCLSDCASSESCAAALAAAPCSECDSECGTSTVVEADGGSVTGDDSGTSGGGSEGVSCLNPDADEAACDSCINSQCSSEVAALDAACPDLLACAAKCDCSDSACLNACAPTGTCAAAAASASCAACNSECNSSGTVDAG